MGRIHLRVAAVAASLSVLAGCSSADGPEKDPAPSSNSEHRSSAPSPNSDEPPVDKNLNAAKEALACASKKIDEAVSQPTTDPYVSLRECVGDPFLTAMVNTASEFAKLGIHQEGSTTREVVSSTVIQEQPYEVELTVCVDQSASVFIDANGQKMPESPVGERTLAKFTVLDYGAPDGFLLYQQTNVEPLTPC